MFGSVSRLLSSVLAAGIVAWSSVIVAADGHALEDPIPEPIELGHVEVTLETVVDGMTAPNWGTSVPGCTSLSGRLVVTDQDGILWAVNLATQSKSVLLDVSSRLVSLGIGGPGTFDERGLLGVAFHPDFSQNGFLYTYTSEPVAGSADFSTMGPGQTANHQTVLTEWQVPAPCNPASVVDPASDRELVRIDQPQFNHNAGALTFGPDDMLYVALGDGGRADDQGPGHVPGGNGQDPSNVLGSILRIDPTDSNAANGRYGIPQDNPFVGVSGYAEEVYAFGFRNPFRIAFDMETGELYAADVGQNDIEEVDRVVPGGNYGWRVKEGSFCFDPNGAGPGFVFECGPGDEPPGLIDPVAEYDHDEGIAVVGGFPYRGTAIPQLGGRYVLGDFFHPASGSGRLFFLHANDEILEFEFADRETLGYRLLGFGQDADGELYALVNETGTPFGNTGAVLRLASARPAPRNFRAHLSGDAEVPPVETRARGQALFQFAPDSSDLWYKLIAANVDDVVAAHLHCAPEEVNGPVGATLFSGGPVSPRGVLAEATIVAPNSGNACNWHDLEDVRAAMRNGHAYVNVHTLAHPAGEIRGQVR